MELIYVPEKSEVVKMCLMFNDFYAAFDASNVLKMIAANCI
jgi:hypothetical protein